jgi:hypothetical protein
MFAKVAAVLFVAMCLSGLTRVYAGASAGQTVSFEQAGTGDGGAVERGDEADQRLESNGPVERKYDVNRDGILNATETKDLLTDKYAHILAQGWVKVDFALESAYDTNRDGVIDSSEAVALKSALKE